MGEEGDNFRQEVNVHVLIGVTKTVFYFYYLSHSRYSYNEVYK